LPPPLVLAVSISSVDQITVPATRIVPNTRGMGAP
jgi:hypothetical protein